MRWVTALVIVIGLGAGTVRAADAKPQAAQRLFLWKVSSKVNTIYLLGSIHVATADFYPLADEIENAFAESKVLVVEVDLNKVDSGDMQAALVDRGMYQDADNIARHVPKATLEKLQAYFSRRGLPAAQMEKFRPWALAVTITELEVQSLGFKSDLGIDKHFMDKPAGRPILELESAEAQIDLLSGLPDKLQAELLASTLDSASKTKELMAKTVTLWKTGDAAGLEKRLITDPLKKQRELKGVYVKLFDERNAMMAGKIDGYLKKAKMPHFVVVGAGHLIGEKGIVKLLEKKGYRVEQLTRGTGAKPEAAEAEKKKEKDRYVPADAFSK